VAKVVVVDNASTDGSVEALVAEDPGVVVVATGTNLGYGSGANRGLAATDGAYVLVSNPDVALHGGALERLRLVLDAGPTIAVAGPCIREPDGARYPSARRFPSVVDATGHALLGQLWPENRFSRRYRMAEIDAAVTTPVDWVSGACFLARRDALEELGGFDEGYFMYMEDVDLCWRAHRAGWGVAYVPEAEVTHLRGVSTAHRPYRMLVAHHRSALRFASHTTTGSRRLLLPGAAVVLGLRLALAAGRQALGPRR
jgi:N-acetylglucosaminyl-diphospho-decaprenol L-rhamnosyltransferase